jgi:hypothetical protein
MRGERPRSRVHSAIRSATALPPSHWFSGLPMTSVSRGASGIAVLSAGGCTIGMLAPRSNSASTSLRIAGLISVSSSREARRSLTTFFRVA